MGKRLRGAKLRAKKRGTVAEREIVEKQAVQAEEGSVANKADDELFVLDTTAVVESKKQIAKKENKKKKQKQSVPAHEELQIQKLIDTHSAEKLRAMAKKTSITAKRAPKHIKMKQNRPKRDLWADEEDESSSAIVTKKSAPIAVSSGPHGIVPSQHIKVATRRALPQQIPLNKDRLPVTVDLAKSGQSYNPDAEGHKIAIVEALKIETKRDKAEKESKKSASQGMSAETRALLVGDTDTEDEDDSDDDSDGSEMVILQRRPEKMTRAQRNKQKRIRAEQYEIRERKRQKQWQHELRGVKSAKKKLEKEELERKAEKEKSEELKLESVRSKGKDVYQQLADENPRYAPTYPVALPGELKSGTSLRRIKPKGSLVTDRLVSLMDRGMTAKKQLKLKMRVQGKRRKVKVRGKAKWNTNEGRILG